jgi:hypothetical protein
MLPMPVRSKTIMRFIFLSWVVLICVVPGCSQTAAQVIAAAVPISDPQNTSQDISQLEPGRTLDGKISAGQTHNYRISASSGQFINLFVEQRALGLTVTLHAPDGARLLGGANRRKQLSLTTGSPKLMSKLIKSAKSRSLTPTPDRASDWPE